MFVSAHVETFVMLSGLDLPLSFTVIVVSVVLLKYLWRSFFSWWVLR